MSETTYISEELIMEGTLDSSGSAVVIAGRFKGELRAKDVLLESNSVFDKSNAWDEARLRSRNRSNSLFSKTILFIIILLTLIFLYIIDFDLSIFMKWKD